MLEALRSEASRLQKIYLAHGKVSPALARVRAAAKQARVPCSEKSASELDRLAEGGNHQGVVGLVRPFESVSPEEMLDRAAAAGVAPLILALDQGRDPQNLGSLIRSAEGAGAHGVLLSKHDSAPVTGVVGRASAGALEYVSVAQVTNLVRTLEDMKTKGLWVFGADASAEASIYEADFTVPVVLVIGSEDRGIRPLVKKTCDALYRIPLLGRIHSLNAAVSGALVLYEAVRQRLSASSTKP